MTVGLPAHLSDMVSNLGRAATALADEVRADRADRAAKDAADRAQNRKESRRMTWLLMIIGVLVAALTALSVSNRLISNQNRSIISTIKSCTSAEGACAQASQKRTAVVLTDLINRLTKANIEVAACARTTSTDTAYRECVDQALAALNAPPAPARTTPPPR